MMDITHVNPTGNQVGFTGVTSPHYPGHVVSSVLEKFRVGHPKVLGTVQIMIGLVMLLIGIVMASTTYGSVGVYSGIFVWGSVTYIIAGSLTVAADYHLNSCLVTGCLGVNTAATANAFIGIILHSIDSTRAFPLISGITGVLAVLSFLEFIVSIYVSVIASMAVGQCCCPEPVQVFIVGNQTPVPQHGTMNPGNTALSSQTNFQVMNCPGEPVGGAMGTGFQQNIPPPQYTAAFS
ncbi:hypothetical protein UPYG_G00096240 [Umbra pygmaea]|uniref:Membrane-spanning 4-domains subfamily A member 15 n=1 Tax=Umbra pygmaea TaxID=75934 RepID=A0ABD0WZX0_UMBPY